MTPGNHKHSGNPSAKSSDSAPSSPDYKNTVKLPPKAGKPVGQPNTKRPEPTVSAAADKGRRIGQPNRGPSEKGQRAQGPKQSNDGKKSRQGAEQPSRAFVAPSRTPAASPANAASMNRRRPPEAAASAGAGPNRRPDSRNADTPKKNRPKPVPPIASVTKSKDRPKEKIRERSKGMLRVIPLGGLGEIGKNMTLFEFGNDIILVDCGVAFPEENMPGIDAVIQDYTYVLQNKDRVRGVFLTHGHEDHIGALPYLMRDLKCPIYGGRLTIELVREKLMEKIGGARGIALQQVNAGDVVRAGNDFAVEFIHVNHSIADAFALAIRTPVGNVIHTGDFKIDYTPIDGGPIDLQRFSQYGANGVLLLMAESTNIEIPGTSISESQVGESFQRIMQKAKGRVIIATFSSHVHRMQQIFTAAEKFNRKVALVGRSMLTVFAAANSLGYIDMKPDTLIDIMDIDHYPPERVVILTTGSQAEPMSALTRMAFSSHKAVEIQQGDTVVLSAHPIPGNEKPIYRVINELFRRGAKVIYEDLADVHVSGHAYRGELMLIHELVKPKFFIPVHGEYRMLFKHSELAKSLGQKDDSIFILNNGDIFECSQDTARVSGYVNAAPVLIDGSGFGDLDNRVLRDRKLLADDGIVSVSIAVDRTGVRLLADPIVQAMGFLYESESEAVIRDTKDKLLQFIAKCGQQNKTLSAVAESGQMRDYLKTILFEKTKRRPMILISVSRITGA